MNHHPGIRRRHSIRLKGYDYSQPGAYFVTIVTQDRLCLFGDVVGGTVRLNGAGRLAQAAWERLPCRFPGIDLDAFVVMPNHIHGIIAINGPVGAPPAGAPDATGASDPVGTVGAPLVGAPDATGAPDPVGTVGAPLVGAPDAAGAPDATGAPDPVGTAGAPPVGAPDAAGAADPVGTVGAPLVGAPDATGAPDPVGTVGAPLVGAPDPVGTVGAPLVGALPSRATTRGARATTRGARATTRGARATTRGAPTVGDVVGAYKSLTTVEYTRGVRAMDWPPFRRRLWQRNYYERIVRDDESRDRIRQYILDNPAQWGSDRENPIAARPRDGAP